MAFCGYAQHAIYYSYDAAGNRISRELRSQPQKGMRKYQDRDTIKKVDGVTESWKIVIS